MYSARHLDPTVPHILNSIRVDTAPPRIYTLVDVSSISETSILGLSLRSAARGFGSRSHEPISGHARTQGAYSLTNNLTLLDFSVACNKTSLQASSPISTPWLIGLWRYYCATVTPAQTITSRYKIDRVQYPSPIGFRRHVSRSVTAISRFITTRMACQAPG